MKKNIFIPLALIMALNATAQIKYPQTNRGDVYDDYFGTRVYDPYRWLEDENSKETRAWVEAQNATTFNYLDKIPFRDTIRERLTQLWDYPKHSIPFKEGEYYLYYKNSGKQNQSVLYIQKGLDGEASVLLDPNTFSADGTTSLSQFAMSHDHKYAAYGISKAGSDWNEFYVIDLPSGTKRSDQLVDIKFSGIAWYKDGFFYSRFDKPTEGRELTKKNSFGKLYYHKLGTPQSQDELIYEDPQNPTHMFGAEVTEDEQYLILTISESTSGNQFYFKKLGEKNAAWVKAVTNFDHTFSLIDAVDGNLWVYTNYGASRYKLISIDPKNPQPENWKTIIAEKNDLLQSISLLKGRVLATYLNDVKSLVKTFDYAGNDIGQINLPGLGMVSGFFWQKNGYRSFFFIHKFYGSGQHLSV